MRIRVVPGSLRGAVSAAGVRTVSGVLELHDRGGSAVQLLRQPSPAGAATRLRWAADDQLLSVGGGATLTTTVSWEVVDCRQSAAASSPEQPGFAVRLPQGDYAPLVGYLGAWFPEAWAGAHARACGSGRGDLG